MFVFDILIFRLSENYLLLLFLRWFKQILLVHVRYLPVEYIVSFHNWYPLLNHACITSQKSSVDSSAWIRIIGRIEHVSNHIGFVSYSSFEESIDAKVWANAWVIIRGIKLIVLSNYQYWNNLSNLLRNQTICILN